MIEGQNKKLKTGFIKEAAKSKYHDALIRASKVLESIIGASGRATWKRISSRIYVTFTLWLLEKGKMHGYELLQEMRSAGMEQIRASRIYPLLNKLEDAGLITSKVEGRRKVYSITAVGKAWLRISKKVFNNRANMVSNFLRDMVCEEKKK